MVGTNPSAVPEVIRMGEAFRFTLFFSHPSGNRKAVNPESRRDSLFCLFPAYSIIRNRTSGTTVFIDFMACLFPVIS